MERSVSSPCVDEVPLAPHAEVSRPVWQKPFASQQPAQLFALQVAVPPAVPVVPPAVPVVPPAVPVVPPAVPVVPVK